MASSRRRGLVSYPSYPCLGCARPPSPLSPPSLPLGLSEPWIVPSLWLGCSFFFFMWLDGIYSPNSAQASPPTVPPALPPHTPPCVHTHILGFALCAALGLAHSGDLALVSLPAQSSPMPGSTVPVMDPGAFPKTVEGYVASLEKINPLPRGVDPSAATQRASPQPWLVRTSTLLPRRSSECCKVSGGDRALCRGAEAPRASSHLSFQSPCLIQSPGLPRPSRGT